MPSRLSAALQATRMGLQAVDHASKRLNGRLFDKFFVHCTSAGCVGGTATVRYTATTGAFAPARLIKYLLKRLSERLAGFFNANASFTHGLIASASVLQTSSVYKIPRTGYAC